MKKIIIITIILFVVFSIGVNAFVMSNPNYKLRGIISDGIDILASLGTPIKAASSGKVVYVGFMKGYGNLIIIEHDNVFNTIYAQNQVNLVNSGEYIKKGRIIAHVGNPGKKDKKPHLHFEIRKYNNAVNPLWYLK